MYTRHRWPRGRAAGLVCAALLSFASVGGAEPPTGFVAAMNAGKAHLENREADQALAAYERAVTLQPKSLAARLNAALAHLLVRQKEEPGKHLTEALKHLAEAKSLDPDCVAAHYLSGLAHVHLNDYERAVKELETSARLDPATAAIRYQLANAYKQLGRHDQAQEQLRKTIELDPLHASAHYQLAMYARRERRQGEARNYIKEFTRLRKMLGEAARDPNMLERCIHTRARDPESPAEPPPAGIAVRFVDVTDKWCAGLSVPSGPGAAAGVLDVDGDEKWDLLLADAKGSVRLWTGREGGFSEAELLSLPPRAWSRCLMGDYDNDGLTDALLVGATGCALLHQLPEARFEDATEKSGLGDVTGVDGAWVDFDHDGDLDVLIAGGAGRPASLWLNRGNGTFAEHSEQAGVPRDLAGVVGVAAADIHTDDALDLVLASESAASTLLINTRQGRYRPMGSPPGPWPSAVGAAMDDLNNDGHPDVLLVGPSEALLLYSEGAGRNRFDVSGMEPTRGLLFDYDNDGWLDVWILGKRKPLAVWRNLGRAGFAEVTEAVGLGAVSGSAFTDALPADFDGDGDGDLLLTGSGGAVFLRNDGADANIQLRLTLEGTKTNRTALGAALEIRAGTTRVCRSVSRLPVEVGVGAHRKLDSVRVVWTNGVVQNEMNVAVPAGRGLQIKEKKVATGSCPFLYAWDGERFRFVTDLLGNSPLGLSAARDKFLPADPTEHVWVGESSNFVPRQGRYLLQVTDEFREILYLDEARLVAVDHAEGTQVHPVDKLRPPPFPRSDLWVLRDAAPLISATGDGGTDWTDTLREIDGAYSFPPKLRRGQLRGQAEPYAITFDFGTLAGRRPLVLALTGWLQWGDASANISSSQNPDLPVVFPKLEVELGTGDWRPVDVVVGMPAGKTKTILVDLTDRLPQGARRLRLTTTFQLQWDRAALMEKCPAGKRIEYTLSPVAADLHSRGFSDIRARGPHHPTTPDYDAVSARPPWQRLPRGWCTRYGDVLELVERTDDRFAILNGGDELTLEFEARDLPPPRPNMKRTFFFYAVGWDKDADHNVSLGDTVEPLPFNGLNGAEYGRQSYPAGNPEENWQLDYNTRYVPSEPFE